jgi:hypothetical protein
MAAVEKVGGLETVQPVDSTVPIEKRDVSWKTTS